MIYKLKQKTIPLLMLLIVMPLHAQTQRLLNTRDMYPSVSPDNRLVVFQSNRAGSNQIFIMNMDGSGLKQLTDSLLGAETPAFSPDGQHIVFDVYVGENNNDVFTIRPDGSDLTQLTSSPGYDGHPHWSSDGSRIVFNSDRTTPVPDTPWSDRWHEIFSMNADGSDVRQHTRCESVCTFGSLSPGGTKLLYRKVTKSEGLNWALNAIPTNSEIFISDIDGSNEKNLSGHPAFDGWPLWSPDGKTIAFASNRSGPPLTGQIWLMNSDGSGLRRLTDDDLGHAQPAWSADGKNIFAYQFKETPDYEYGSIVRVQLLVE